MKEIFDGKTLTVFVPMKFTRRGARKRIVAPDGTALAPVTKPQPNGKLMTALVRAWRWQKLIESREIRVGQGSGAGRGCGQDLRCQDLEDGAARTRHR